MVIGCRDLFPSCEYIKALLDKYTPNVTEVVSGGAKGVDTQAMRTAFINEIPFKEFKANWDKYGNKAGIIRNCEMVEYSDFLIAIWDGQSHGTHHSIKEMFILEKPVIIHYFNQDIENEKFKQQIALRGY